MGDREADLLLRALVCHLLNTGGKCIITEDEINLDKTVGVVEEPGKLTITVEKKTTRITH